jgi:hypothetical protein
MIITYRHRPNLKRKAVSQPAKITGPAIVRARKPKKYMLKKADLADVPW